MYMPIDSLLPNIMKKFNITKKQRDLFNFIKDYIDKNNMAPSYEEMKEGTGCTTKCTIFTKINQLQDRGWITKLPGKNRSITIVKKDLNEDTSI